MLMVTLETLTAFALLTVTTSLIPGPSMVFVLTQSILRGTAFGLAALAGLQVGYVFWWILAALGLGTVAQAFPMAFQIVGLAGALYLGWLGLSAFRNAGSTTAYDHAPPAQRLAGALRDGVVVALSNPKALVYMVALLPPFIDENRTFGPQLMVLATTAFAIDVALSLLYIFAGTGLAKTVSRPSTRKSLDMAVGIIFITLAASIIGKLLVFD
jgi:threonine/homoserine/homoserine lactone efflux protein